MLASVSELRRWHDPEPDLHPDTKPRLPDPHRCRPVAPAAYLPVLLRLQVLSQSEGKTQPEQESGTQFTVPGLLFRLSRNHFTIDSDQQEHA